MSMSLSERMRALLRIEFERKNRGWSKLDLAAKTGIYPSDIYKIEEGKGYLWPKWAQKLEEIFDIPADKLLEEVE